MSADIVIEAKNIAKCYRVFDTPANRLKHALWPRYTKGMSEVWALHDVSFTIRRGEAVAIIGRNGGGKSTLLEILTGTLTPSQGSVTVNGRVSALLELGSGFNPEFSGRDNVMLNGLLLGLKREDILARFDEIEAFAEIGAAIERPVKTYSSGMMMRLAFAVQVLCDPDILIIDEALSVGDFFFQQKCLGFIRGLLAKGTTLLFVSHDMGTVRNLCVRTIYLKAGELAFDGNSDDGIFKFLTEQTEDADAPLTINAKAESNTRDEKLAHAIWQGQEQGLGKMHAVFISDSQGRPTTTITMGQTMRIGVLFEPHSDAPNHITICLTNRYKQIVTTTGSLQLGTPPIIATESAKLMRYDIDIDLCLEAGLYSLQVTLGYTTGINRGGRFDQTPHIGPITVDWDYENNTAPFIGMCGLPAKDAFTSAENGMT